MHTIIITSLIRAHRGMR